MKENDEFRPWRLVWTPKHIARFWNWWGSNPALRKHYFSKRNGDSVLNQINRHVHFSGTVVDLGSGPGYIVDLLIKRGVQTLAVDTSLDSLTILEQRLKGSAYFLGTKVSNVDSIPLEDEYANGVLLIETVEHLTDDSLQRLLKEIYRIIKPGGWVAITTPNDEDLAELEIICPDCGCVYHTYQHLRSWSKSTLEPYLANIGFTCVVNKPTLFSSLPILFRPFHKFAYFVLGVKLPHLLYIGQKPIRKK
ncbi:MAG TPA: class I SAM-dependent methyltransferase [Anaerolineales bacterium]|jgi:SAM-dependent methyltransferase